jgi:hypothetical protein
MSLTEPGPRPVKSPGPRGRRRAQPSPRAARAFLPIRGRPRKAFRLLSLERFRPRTRRISRPPQGACRLRSRQALRGPPVLPPAASAFPYPERAGAYVRLMSGSLPPRRKRFPCLAKKAPDPAGRFVSLRPVREFVRNAVRSGAVSCIRSRSFSEILPPLLFCPSLPGRPGPRPAAWRPVPGVFKPLSSLRRRKGFSQSPRARGAPRSAVFRYAAAPARSACPPRRGVTVFPGPSARQGRKGEPRVNPACGVRLRLPLNPCFP